MSIYFFKLLLRWATLGSRSQGKRNHSCWSCQSLLFICLLEYLLAIIILRPSYRIIPPFFGFTVVTSLVWQHEYIYEYVVTTLKTKLAFYTLLFTLYTNNNETQKLWMWKKKETSNTFNHSHVMLNLNMPNGGFLVL